MKDCIVTIDAMGCQTNITHLIIDQAKGDYVLALKGNQGTSVQRDVQDLLAYAQEINFRACGSRFSPNGGEKPRSVWKFDGIGPFLSRNL